MKIFTKQISDKSLLPKIYKEPLRLHNVKNYNRQFLKYGQRSWIEISPKKIDKWLIGRWKKCYKLHVVREMQSKITERHHHIFLLE
jgi:hypothetical protein